MMNRCEAAVDAIRDKIYEETKDLPREEQIKQVNDIAQKAAEKYGFTIGTPNSASGNKSKVI